jgi:hypothetical protein
MFEASFLMQNESVGRTKNHWIIQEIKISYKHKRHLYVDNRSSNNPYMRAYYIKYRKILSRVIKEAKRQYYNRLIAKLNNQI